MYEDETAEQAAVDTAAADLNSAYDALVRVSDKTELQALMAEANELSETDYTAETWNALQEALEAAAAVDAEHDASQEDVDSAAQLFRRH